MDFPGVVSSVLDENSSSGSEASIENTVPQAQKSLAASILVAIRQRAVQASEIFHCAGSKWAGSSFLRLRDAVGREYTDVRGPLQRLGTGDQPVDLRASGVRK